MTHVLGVDTPRTVWDQDPTLITNIFDTQAVVGSPEVSVVFRAPTSGRVNIIVGGGARDSGGAQRIFIGAEVYKSHNNQVLFQPGGVFFKVADVSGYVTSPPETQFTYGQRHTILEGLIPGEEYYCPVVHWCSAQGTGGNQISVREIIVIPIP